MTKKLAAAVMPAPGMVSTQAVTMFVATPHRTADSRLVAPTPMMDVVMTWVVEIGAPNTRPAIHRIEAAVVSAAKPCGGGRGGVRRARGRRIRPPPAEVARP